MGPLLRSELGNGPYMAGSEFTALDIVFGYNMEVIIKLTINSNNILAGIFLFYCKMPEHLKCAKVNTLTYSSISIFQCVFCKREWYADELPSLKEYYERLKQERPLYQKGFQPIEERFLR